MVYKRFEQSSRTINFLKFAEKVRLEVQKEINDHELGNGLNGTLPQLKNILDEIEQMKVNLSKEKYLPRYPTIIVDSWSFNSKLGDELLDLNNKYKKL